MLIGAFGKAMAALQASDFTFYLTGSRYFDYAVDGSDWDFFVQKPLTLSNALIRLLEDSGFQEMSAPMDVYKDVNTFRVYWHPGEQIHVQIVQDATMKVRVQEILKGSEACHFVVCNGSKITQRHMWDLMFKIYHKASVIVIRAKEVT